MSLLLFFGGGAGESDLVGDVSRYVFCGRLRVIDPEPAIAGLRTVTCVCSGWLSDFADVDAVDLALRKDVRPDELLQDLVDLAETPPANVDFDEGRDVYPFAFDDLAGNMPKATQVAQDVLQSELGYLYERGDETDGETLRFENRHARALVTPAHTFTETDIENAADVLQVPSSLDTTFNDFEVLTVPRRPDAAATTALVRLDAPVEVAPGQTERIFVDYKDPNNEAVFVGGDDMQAMDVVTDWTASTAEDGSGADCSGSFSVAATCFGSRAMIELTNNGLVTGYVRGPGGAEGLQVRGRGLYRYREVSCRAVNQASIDQYDARPLPAPLLMPYQSSRNIGLGAAQFLASAYGSQVRVPTRVRIGSDNRTPVLEEQAILRDVGDCIAIPVAGETVSVFIHGLEQELTIDGRLRTTYTIAPADPTTYFVIDDPTLGQLDSGGVLGYA